MKKIIKSLLLVVLIVPCLLLSACTQDLTRTQYNSKMTEAAKTYYQTKDKNNMTITTTKKTNNSWKQNVYYGAEDELESREIFSTDTEETQKLELFTSTNETRFIRVTETTKTTNKGVQENEAETGIEPYTHVEEETKVVTFTLTFVGEDWVGKAYISEKDTFDGVPEDEEKSVYTYDTIELWQQDVNVLVYSINSYIFEDGFFNTDYIMFLSMYGLDTEFYANNDKNFGLKYSLEMSYVVNKAIENYSMSSHVYFENGLPCKITSTTCESISEQDSSFIPEVSNTSNTITAEININYSSATINVPTGYDEAEIATYSPAVNILAEDIFVNIILN